MSFCWSLEHFNLVPLGDLRMLHQDNRNSLPTGRPSSYTCALVRQSDLGRSTVPYHSRTLDPSFLPLRPSSPPKHTPSHRPANRATHHASHNNSNRPPLPLSVPIQRYRHRTKPRAHTTAHCRAQHLVKRRRHTDDLTPCRA